MKHMINITFTEYVLMVVVVVDMVIILTREGKQVKWEVIHNYDFKIQVDKQ